MQDQTIRTCYREIIGMINLISSNNFTLKLELLSVQNRLQELFVLQQQNFQQQNLQLQQHFQLQEVQLKRSIGENDNELQQLNSSKEQMEDIYSYQLGLEQQIYQGDQYEEEEEENYFDFEPLIVDINDENKDDCSICLNEFRNHVTIKFQSNNGLEQCNHMFHRECIEQWFANNQTCPLCKFKFFGFIQI